MAWGYNGILRKSGKLYFSEIYSYSRTSKGRVHNKSPFLVQWMEANSTAVTLHGTTLNTKLNTRLTEEVYILSYEGRVSYINDRYFKFVRVPRSITAVWVTLNYFGGQGRKTKLNSGFLKKEKMQKNPFFSSRQILEECKLNNKISQF